MPDPAHTDPELIEVRADEGLDTARLEPWLRQHVPEEVLGGGGKPSVRQFGGGHANLTYCLSFGDREVILRRPPLGPIAPSSHDMGREHRVLSRLSKVFALAPDSYAYCGDESIVGAEFQIMERRHGFVIRTEIPERFRNQPTLNRRIGEMMVDALADLHLVDAEAAGLGDLGRPEGFAGRQLAGWTKRWHAAKEKDLAPVDAVISWLERGLPESGRASIIHNDFKLDNILVGDDDPGTAVAILDWDMCTRGDPLMDLGYLLNFWIEEGDDSRWIGVTGMPTNQPGFASREAAVERYAARTGFDCGDVLWYYVFGIFKLVVIIQQIYIRYLRGQTRDQRFAIFGERVEGLAQKAASLAKV